MEDSKKPRKQCFYSSFALLTAVIILPLFFPAAGCGKGNGHSSTGKLKSTGIFAYQIQDQTEGGNLELLAGSHYDLLIIDQTRSLKGEEDYDSKSDVEVLKESAGSNGEKKTVICYLDVGEAESYRWYWKDDWRIGRPKWIVAEDPDGWNENFPVKFWSSEWKSLMKTSIDMIIEDGYDGIYMDWLEVYSFKPVVEAAKEEGLDPVEELAGFVSELADYARSKDPGFIFIAQNATELYDEPGYAGNFDAIAQEAIWFDGGGDPDSGGKPGDVQVDPKLTGEYLDNLAGWQELGIPVLDVEYACDRENSEEAYKLGEEHGFKTYVTLRPLDRLTGTPPPGY